ncbi:hypothetical protein RIF29_39226 [Crotalaria pallida]|uniref:GRF-type domain-containing protein n=1 Tax=Crotalaria pallida TaxID=3830 RepID=A0AAN9E667_CROPI
MSSVRPGSSCSCSSSLASKHYSKDPPLCKCGVEALLRFSRTAEHYGWRFWGCRFYQKDKKDSGCGNFEWFNDDDEKERVIREQRMKIAELQAALDATRSELSSALIELKLKKKEVKGMKRDAIQGIVWRNILSILCLLMFALNLYLIRV